MASISYVYDDLSECSICGTLYTDPKALPCLHTFCLKCLDQYVDSRPEASLTPPSGIPCPICRQDFVVPAGGCTNLPRNFFLARLVEMHQVTGTQTGQTKCEACGEVSTDDNNANQYCIECRQRMCISCVKLHKMFNATKNHNIRVLDDKVFEEVVSARASHCDLHSEELLNLYCLRCKVPICVRCFAVQHTNHGCADIKDIGGKGRTSIDFSIANITQQINDEEEFTNAVSAVQQELLKNVSEKEKAICVTIEEITRAATARQTQLLKELQSIKQSAVKLLEEIAHNADFHKTSLYSLRQFAQAVRDNGTDVEVARLSTSIVERAKGFRTATRNAVQLPVIEFEITRRELITSAVQQLLPGLKTTMITPKLPQKTRPHEEDIVLEDVSGDTKTRSKQTVQVADETTHKSFTQVPATVIGAPSRLATTTPAITHKHIGAQVRPQDKYVSVAEKVVSVNPTADVVQPKAPLTQPTKVHETPPYTYLDTPVKIATIAGDPVGVAMLNKEIYVARYHKADIEVYSGDKYGIRRSISVRGLRDPQDIAACQLNNCVYICGRADRVVYIVTSAGGLVKQWATTMAPWALSVTAMGNVVVTMHDDRKLQEFNSQGRVLRVTALPADMVTPWHAVQYTDYTYIVCHGEFGADDQPHRVCEVHANGKVLRHYGGKQGDEANQLNVPSSVAVDPLKRILVTDHFNSRVHLLDSDLNLVRHLLTEKDGIDSPRRMWLDKESGLLLVGSSNSLMVFQVYENVAFKTPTKERIVDPALRLMDTKPAQKCAQRESAAKPEDVTAERGDAQHNQNRSVVVADEDNRSRRQLLRNWLNKQNWVTQHSSDRHKSTIRINAAKIDVLEAEERVRAASEKFQVGNFVFEISATKPARMVKTIGPGDIVVEQLRNKAALFSGQITGKAFVYGLTVNHLFTGNSSTCYIRSPTPNTQWRPILANCALRIPHVHTPRTLVFAGEAEEDVSHITADIAFLNIQGDQSSFGIVDNRIDFSGKMYRVRLFKGDLEKKANEKASVMFRDSKGVYQFGSLDSYFSSIKWIKDDVLDMENSYFETLAIRGEDGQRINDFGDSGALLLSVPEKVDAPYNTEPAILDVYGIVIGFCVDVDPPQLSKTIATRLWEVLIAIARDDQYSQTLGLTQSATIDDVDFYHPAGPAT